MDKQETLLALESKNFCMWGLFLLARNLLPHAMINQKVKEVEEGKKQSPTQPALPPHHEAHVRTLCTVEMIRQWVSKDDVIIHSIPAIVLVSAIGLRMAHTKHLSMTLVLSCAKGRGHKNHFCAFLFTISYL